jgi:hypothetical protein
MKKSRYYSINGKGKYMSSIDYIPDSNGMIKAYDTHKNKTIMAKRSSLIPWVNPVGVNVLRGR